jgi:small subunit ribosomal protein S18
MVLARFGNRRPKDKDKDKDKDKGKKKTKFFRKKKCFFCAEKVEVIDYKEVDRLRRHITERGKIIPRRITGNCSYHQRHLTKAIKRARNVALLPYAAQ